MTSLSRTFLFTHCLGSPSTWPAAIQNGHPLPQSLPLDGYHVSRDLLFVILYTAHMFRFFSSYNAARTFQSISARSPVTLRSLRQDLACGRRRETHRTAFRSRHPRNVPMSYEQTLIPKNYPLSFGFCLTSPSPVGNVSGRILIPNRQAQPSKPGGTQGCLCDGWHSYDDKRRVIQCGGYTPLSAMTSSFVRLDLSLLH